MLQLRESQIKEGLAKKEDEKQARLPRGLTS